jgi:tRNA pseudouridine13 synthase
MNTFFDPEVVKQTVALFNRILDSPHRKQRECGSVKSAPIKERDLRTKIHQELRRIFQSRLESYTDDTGSMIISAAAGQGKWGAKSGPGRNPGGRTDSGRPQQQKARPGWKELGGEYLHFTLYKENKDTMEVVSYLARSLKIKPQSFQFAGTKDRRGVTVQRISVYRVQAERMVPVGKTLRNAKIGNYEYQPRGLELGELTGNEFLITLRDCQFNTATEVSLNDRLKEVTSIVDSAAKSLGEKGYINYFGLQRFGTFSTRTDTIGRKMLKGDFQGAVEAILDFSPQILAAAQNPISNDETISYDDKARASAIHSFQTTGKSYPALDNLPRKFSAETNTIRHLGVKDRATDYLGALQTIPRNLRLMYVHAYQSLIWNLAASHRWRIYGEKVHVGDLVLIGEHKDKTIADEELENVDADGEIIVQPAADDSAAPEEDRFERARALTEDDIASGKYSIYDVVLPTPGFDILYPENETKAFYEEVMASEIGGGLNPHDMRRQWKDISLSGSYRKLLAKPMSPITFSLHTYTRDDEQFVETDLDKLQKRNQQASIGSAAVTKDAAGNGESQTLTEALAQGPEEVKVAVVLKMQLGSSQYATMALRELMKLGGVRTYKPDFGGGR